MGFTLFSAAHAAENAVKTRRFSNYKTQQKSGLHYITQEIEPMTTHVYQNMCHDQSDSAVKDFFGYSLVKQRKSSKHA